MTSNEEEDGDSSPVTHHSSLVLVVNPAAGRGRCGKAWPALARAIKSAGIEFDCAFTKGPGDATRLAAASLGSGATTVVAVGGDGTANEVANGFFRPDAADGELLRPDARFAFLPIGTGTDLARGLGIPARSPSPGIAALGPLARTVRVDVGRVRFRGHDGQSRQRYFLIGADLGLGGETAALALSTAERTKALGGFVAYLVAAILAILRHRARSVTYAIDDGPLVAARTDLIFVANCRYIGGGMLVAPPATLDDGRLDLILVDQVGKLDLLARLLPAIYRGAHLEHPAVRHVRIRQIRVESDEPLLLQLDGEQPGTSPAEFNVVPSALTVALPPL